jgi:hypothetical protein
MSNSGRSKVNLAAMIRKMIHGLTQHYAGQSLRLGGATVQVEALLAHMQPYAPQVRTTDAAHPAWATEVVALDALATSIYAELVLLRAVLRAAFGPAKPQLADFGVVAHQPVVKPPRREGRRGGEVARHPLGAPHQRTAPAEGDPLTRGSAAAARARPARRRTRARAGAS